jgi:hypothetical protein
MLHNFRNFGFKYFEVLSDIVHCIFDWNDSMLAMLHGRIHAAGAKNLAANGAVYGKDDVMDEAPL